MPYAIEDCIPVTATKTGLFAVDVWIDSPTIPSDTSHWIGLELLKSSVGADYQTTGIIILLHYDGTIEVLGANGIGIAKIDTDIIPIASTTFSTHWGGAMTKVTIHVVGNLVNVYVDNTLTLSFITFQSGGFNSLAKYGNVNAYFDTFIMRSYIEPNPDQTTWGAEEVYFITYEETYDIDVIFQRLGIPKTTSIDVLFKRLEVEKTDSISVLFKKLAIPETYSASVIFKRINIPKTESIDVLFKRLGVTKIDSIDVLFKRLGIQLTYNTDVILKALGLTKQYDISVILEALILKDYDISVILQGLGLIKTYDNDVLFKALGITKLYIADLIFKRLGMEVPYDLSVIFERIEIEKTYDVDVIFKKISGTVTKDYVIDTIIKRLGITKDMSIDVIFKRLGISQTYNIDVIFYQHIPTKHINYMLDLILIAAIFALGGGHPEEIDRPTFKIEYIDKTYNIRVKPLRVVRHHKQTFETKELNHAFKGGAKISCSGLDIPKAQILNIPAKQLSMVMRENYDISIPELIILVNCLSSISTLPLQIPLSAISSFNTLPFNPLIKKGMEIDILPLVTVKINNIAIPISRLNLIFKDSISTAVMPLSTRKKRMTKLQLLELLDQLDELDD